MFGQSAYAQAPFASKAGAIYTTTILESASLGDSELFYAGFVESITEPATLNDANAEQDIFYFGNSDAVVASADIGSISAQYINAITETLTSSEAEHITAQFAGSITEALTSLESSIIGSAYTFTTNENTGITEAYVASATLYAALIETFTSTDTPKINANFVVFENEAMALMESLNVHGWVKIYSARNANWNNVEVVTYTHQAAMMLGGSPFAVAPFAALSDNRGTVKAPWYTIQNTQNANWSDIPDAQ
jgi:hypothetical protein